MPISEAKKKSNAAYNRRQDNIMLRPSKEDGARIRKAAADAGKSVQRYCLDILLKSVPDEVPNAETQAAIDGIDNREPAYTSQQRTNLPDGAFTGSLV